MLKTPLPESRILFIVAFKVFGQNFAIR